MLLAPLAALAQSDLLTLSQGSTSSGEIALNLSLTSSAGQQPAALQWTLSYSPADFTAIQVTAGPAAMAAGKQLELPGWARGLAIVVGVFLLILGILVLVYVQLGIFLVVILFGLGMILMGLERLLAGITGHPLGMMGMPAAQPPKGPPPMTPAK
jgi:hypothetical protein